MDKNYFKSKQYSVAEDILSLCITIALTVYMGLGFYINIWHPTWLIFVGAIIISVVAYIVGYIIFKKANKDVVGEILQFNKQFDTTPVYAKSVKVSGFLFILTIVIYVVVASVTSMWHPLWLLFLVMAIVEQTIALVFKCLYKDYKTNQEIVVSDKECGGEKN